MSTRDNIRFPGTEEKAQEKLASRKFRWLEILAQDPTLTGRLPTSIAIALVTHFFQKSTQDARAGAGELAKYIKATRNNTQDALGKLIKAGHLGCEHRARGDTNRYWMILDDASPRTTLLTKELAPRTTLP
jgi:hypothetical protein